MLTRTRAVEPSDARRWSAARRQGVLVVALAASVRLVVLVAGSRDRIMFLGGDSDEYLALADGPAGYWDRSSPTWDLSFVRPPGYPMILAPIRALSSSLLVAGFFQVALGVLAAWLTYRAGLLILGERPALIAGAWVALDPATVVQSTRLLTEVPFAAALAIWVMCAARALRDRSALWAALAGSALATATFIRPISLYLPLLLGPALVVVTRARLSPEPDPGREPRSGARPFAVGLAFMLAFSLPVGAWFVRNHSAGGITTFSTIEGVNLLDYRAAASIAEEDGITLEAGRQQARAALAEHAEPGSDGPALDHQKAEVGRKLILDHPVGYAIQAAKGLARTLLGTQRAETSEFTGTLPGGSALNPVLTVTALGSALLLIAGTGAGTVVALRRCDLTVLVTLVVPLAYMLTVGSGLESDARFRVPLVPAMAILTAYALSSRTSHAPMEDDDDTVIHLREPPTDPQNRH